MHTYPGRARARRLADAERASSRSRGKTVNPQWNIPESIRKEHIAERGDPRTFIPGGAPDNPLGKYRLELTLPMYGIHGTDIPWGVGMQVSHGCVRLYPEDIERLFPLVPVGTPGRVRLPAGEGGPARRRRLRRGPRATSTATTPALYREAMAALERRGLAGGSTSGLLERGLDETRRHARPRLPESTGGGARDRRGHDARARTDDDGAPRPDDGQAAR